MATADISIIIPVLNETGAIRAALDRIFAQPFHGAVEVIVVDGDARGSTVAAIKDLFNVICLVSPPGRAVQMNAGAGAATGRIICFLHCDCILPDSALQRMVALLEDPAVDAGAFNLSIDAKGWPFRMIGKTASLRSRFTRIPYGDQAIFMRRKYFTHLGGFADIPIMEDVDLMQRLKRKHGRLCIIFDPVKTSARRWQKEGLVFTTLRNWTIRILYTFGVSPHRLAAFYRSHQPPPS